MTAATPTPEPAKHQQSAPHWIQFIPFLPFLIALEESVRQPAPGQSKKNAVLGAVHTLLGVAEPLVFAANPGYAGLGPVVDAIVGAFNKGGWPSTSALPAPAPTPSTP